MAERRSAVAHLPRPSAGAKVSLSERRPGAILQVAAWPETLGNAWRISGELLGQAMPHVGSASRGEGFAVLAVAPGRLLIAADSPDMVARLEAALTAADATVTDLSHGRTSLRLEGEAAADVLAKGVAIDLHPAAFPVDRVAQSMIHHIDIVLHRVGPAAFELWVLRSFAQSLVEWLLEAGEEFGIASAR